MSSNDHQQLHNLLKKTGKTDSSDPILPKELVYLISAFLPSSESSAKAYLILSSFCQGVRQNKKLEEATQTLESIFQPLVRPHLEEVNEHDILVGVTFLAALFQVDWQSAASIFQQDGIHEMIMDSVDLNPSEELSLHVARLLGQACGHKPCRAILPPETAKWLEAMSRPSRSDSVRASATVALVKLSKGGASDNSELTAGAIPTVPSTDKSESELALAMKSLVLHGGSQVSTVADAVEGLAYLSVNPAVKEIIAQDAALLKALFTLVPRRKTSSTMETSSSLIYGILLIISNTVSYLPQLSEEQAQMQNLRRMAKATDSEQDSQNNILNSDERVRARCRSLVANGVLDVFPSALAASDSLGIRLEIGKSLLSIIIDQDHRGKVLTAGCEKTLSKIVKTSVTTTTSPSGRPTPTLDTAYLEPIQALAKLAITAAPLQVFGPDIGAIYDVIRPFSLALQHSASLLLQRFETMMALTNLSSHSAEVASRIADADGLVNSVELFLLEDHVMIRRAAMELICNLIVGSEKVFERYGGSEKDGAGVKNKIQVVLALSDVDDLATRLAASGALATLTAAPAAVRALQSLQLERHRALPIIAQLIDPSTNPDESSSQESDPGLEHRGVICARNVLLTVKDEDRKVFIQDAKSSGLLQALTSVVKQVRAPQVVQPAAEALQWILQPP